ncbi:DUF695 domain-containing protein [Rubellicoccus peritrichatus]|uniref:DUF695 domain-containing protein n=1 Tax=Rubellicoccus peritrichatus TaxID=3080537 RepID=A0AAQ3QRJ1_9BACT|nr:DUF695 domain-containing protein [Puniceicoccus sp. CR14]WOO41393.1 DUF695 domain-containing protein [Puniceicoccus sp. CR14]
MPKHRQNRPNSKKASSQSGFALREGELDGIYSAMQVNTDLKHFRQRDAYPFHLRVYAAYEPSGSKCLPDDTDQQKLDELENKLIEMIGGASPAVYVGHTTWNGGREFNLYVEDPEAVSNALDSALQNAQLPVEAEIVEDHDWLRVDFFFDYES